MITVSLDGPPDVHDRIRNKPGSWDRAVETFRRLREMRSRGFGVYLGMTLQDENAGAYEAMVRSVQERIGGLRRGDVHVNVMHTGHYYNNAGCAGIRDRDRVSKGLADIRRLGKTSEFGPVAFLERRYQRLTEQYLRSGRTPVPCQALAASLFMDPSGTVFPCTLFDRPIGNLRDAGYDLRSVWNSEERRMLRQDIRQGRCPQCWTPCEAYQSILAGVLRPGAE